MAALNKKLTELLQELTQYLNDYKLISRFELRLKIKELIQKYKFSQQELEECKSHFQYPLLQFIFLSITTGTPFSIYAPLLHEKRPYNQIFFYHSHTYSPSETILKQAYYRVCHLKLKVLNEIVKNLLIRAGYSIKKSSLTTILAESPESPINCSLFCTILALKDKINSLKLTATDALIIPPGISVDPFIEFYQQFSNDILLAEANVWLIDPESKSISTFIGIPHRKLLKFFTKSELTRNIERLWRPRITEDF
ncbi:MAG: hypothetical protein ACTSRS_14410 [Candidatus Helarchaeota archaeon]